MATTSISKAFAELFSAPLEAVVEAEKQYLKIWKQRLEVIQAIYVEEQAGAGASSTVKREADFRELIETYVPTVNLEGKIDTALTMRIAGVRETSGGASGGLAIGPIHASGAFGFVNRESHESVFQASTSFALSNKQFSLQEYLKAAKLPLVEPSDLTAAIEHLGTDLEARPKIELSADL